MMPPHQRQKALMTLVDVAWEANISVDAVRRLIARGELRAVPVGARSWRVPRSEFERWIARRDATP